MERTGVAPTLADMVFGQHTKALIGVMCIDIGWLVVRAVNILQGDR